MRRLVAAILLLFAVAQLGFRGMQRIRSDVPIWDYASVYAAARTWVHGGDPYDLPAVLDTWRAGDVFGDRSVNYFATVYPPSSLLLITPLSLLSTSASMFAWVLICAALLVLQMIALLDLAELKWNDSRAWILTGAALASAPMQFAILSGQLSLPAISLCVLAFWCARHDRQKLAGALLGVACALKPQLAAPFVAYYLLLRCFAVAGTAMLVGGTIGIASLIAMHLSRIEWYAGWTGSIAETTRIGGVNDYGWAGIFRDEIIDLKMLLIGILHDTKGLRIAVLCITVALLGALFRWFPTRQQRRGRDELLALAALSAISMMPIYHRVYDASLLITALAWALAELDGGRRRGAIVLLVAMVPFLIPFDIVITLRHRIGGIAEMSQTDWWQMLIAPHFAWGLLATAIVLLWIMRRESLISRSATPASATSPAREPTPANRRS